MRTTPLLRTKNRVNLSLLFILRLSFIGVGDRCRKKKVQVAFKIFHHGNRKFFAF